MTTFTCDIEGLDKLEQVNERFSARFTVAELTKRTMIAAFEAGEMLKEEVVGQLIKAIYSQPAPEVLFSGSGEHDHGWWGDTAERTGDLHDAHIHKSEGLLQSVEVDMDHPVSDNAHSNRETVGDYALAVHEGYLQHVPTRDGGSVNTWTFHPGRPWFERAYFEGYDLIILFVEKAFMTLVEECFAEAFA